MSTHNPDRSRPTHDVGALPIRPRIPYLPFNDPNQPWPWFEEAVRDLFRRVGGYTNVEFHGVSGDDQAGIDIRADSDERGHLGIQAKKVANFGARDVAKAVAQATYRADGYILALSQRATVGARTELGKHAKWELWDQVRLSDAVRELPHDEAADYIERNLGASFVAPFLGRGRVTTFIGHDAYFEPFVDPARPINHAWTRVGSPAALDELRSFLASGERVAIVTGPIGIGKTKTAYDLTATPIPGRSTVFHVPGMAVTSEALRELRFGPGLLVVDDAPDVDGLQALLTHALRMPELKILLTGPSSTTLLYDSVVQAGFAPDEVRPIPLRPLTREPTIALVRQVLGNEDPHVEEAIVKFAIDTPLDTILTTRLLRDQRSNPSDLKSNADVRDLVRSLYREIATGRVSDDVPKDDVKATLQLLAALGPAKIEDEVWLAGAAAAVDMDVDRLLRALDALDDAGVLVRRGFQYLIAPEMLRQSILLEALVVRGRQTAFHLRLLEHFPLNAQLLRNIAIADLESRTTDGPDVFTPAWYHVQEIVKSANSLVRAQFLESLNELGFYKPDDVYELVTYLVAHPATNEDTQPFFNAGFVLTHDDVLREIPGVLRFVMLGSPNLVARCVQLLWHLGKESDTNHSREDPLRLITDLAAYEIGVGSGLAARIVDAVGALLDRGERDTPQHSLLDLVAPVLKRDVSSMLSRATQLTIHRTVLAVDSVRLLRDRTISMVAASALGPDDRRADRAIKLLVDLLRDPENQIVEPTLETIASWDRERAMAFDAFDRIIVGGAWPIRELRIFHSLGFYAQYGRTRLVLERAGSILDRLAPTAERNRYRAMIDSFLVFDTFVDLRTEDPAVGEQRRAAFLERTTEQLVAEFPEPNGLLEDLAARLDAIGRAGLGGTPWHIFWEISRLRPDLSDSLGEAILERGDPRYLQGIAPFVATRLERDPASGEAFAHRVLNQGSIEAAIGVSNALPLRVGSDDRDGEMRQRLFARLLSDPRLEVRRAAAHNLLFFKRRYPDRIVALALTTNIDDDAQLANRIFMALPSGIDHADHAILEALVSKLARVPDLEYWPLSFLSKIAPTRSSIVLTLFGARIFDGPDERSYHAIPYVGREFDELIQALLESPSFEQELLALSHRKGLTHRECDRVALLVGRVGEAAPDIVKRMVEAALDDADVEGQQVGVSWLRHVPHEMLTTDVDYVIRILERAYASSEDLGSRLEGPITNALVSGAEAVGHYEPAPSDLRLTAIGDAALQREGLSPYVRRFFEGLRRMGQRRAEHSIRSAEEAFGPQ